MASTPKRPRVFLDVSIGEEPAGRLTIELFADKTPRTCENFRQLCSGEYNGLSYAKVPFHRVIDEFMVQGGDIEKGDGTGITSIYDREAFDDEHLDWREMDAAGLVCSANRGRDTNGSQFFITLEPCPHLTGKHTIFGRLVSGEDTLNRISKVAVDKTDKPIEPVLVARCGELEQKRKQDVTPQQAPAVQAHSGERGRRRKSDPSDDEMDAGTPPPRTGRRSRRQSDNVIDEGLRGRPRARSNSRSASNPIEEEDETSDVSVHKRKRSPSPSRHMDRREEGAESERRRRSLPNQYRDAGIRDHGDTDRYRPSPRRNDRRHASRKDDDRYRPSRERHQNSGRLNSNDGPLGEEGMTTMELHLFASKDGEL
ncbi:putative cyclophilin-type peptidyl-prolyl cis-trans isomerase domain-containing protein [Septoria linicola]|nr:putative cyclophilin-type peptidyl-prolyl cis-trans isomerase domain-containing protein [Septoria linicola]